jgi:hypothetical protein
VALVERGQARAVVALGSRRSAIATTGPLSGIPDVAVGLEKFCVEAGHLDVPPVAVLGVNGSGEMMC